MRRTSRSGPATPLARGVAARRRPVPDLEIVPAGRGWILQMIGAIDALSFHSSIHAALDAGRGIARARGVDLVVWDVRGGYRVEPLSLERRKN